MSPFAEEEARLRKLAKDSVDLSLSLTSRQLCASMLLHAAVSHLKASEAYWEAATEEREPVRLKLVPYTPNSASEL